jgi:hypothetical protein
MRQRRVRNVKKFRQTGGIDGLAQVWWKIDRRAGGRVFADAVRPGHVQVSIESREVEGVGDSRNQRRIDRGAGDCEGITSKKFVTSAEVWVPRKAKW